MAEIDRLVKAKEAMMAEKDALERRLGLLEWFVHDIGGLIYRQASPEIREELDFLQDQYHAERKALKLDLSLNDQIIDGCKIPVPSRGHHGDC